MKRVHCHGAAARGLGRMETKSSNFSVLWLRFPYNDVASLVSRLEHFFREISAVWQCATSDILVEVSLLADTETTLGSQVRKTKIEVR